MAPLVEKYIPSATSAATNKDGSTTPTGGDYSADEFEEDDERPSTATNGLNDKYVVSMEAPDDDAEHAELLGTSKFGGAAGLNAAD